MSIRNTELYEEIARLAIEKPVHSYMNVPECTPVHTSNNIHDKTFLLCVGGCVGGQESLV